jgi:hypothetical protein
MPERFIKYTVFFRHIPPCNAKLVYHHTFYVSRFPLIKTNSLVLPPNSANACRNNVLEQKSCNHIQLPSLL